jgi:DNA-binding NarL/FixJ family response regulator
VAINGLFSFRSTIRGMVANFIRSARSLQYTEYARERGFRADSCGSHEQAGASELGVAKVTVKVHPHKLMKKLGAQSLPDLVRISDKLEGSQIKPAEWEC